MTEISFLIELLLNHKLSKATKDLIAARIKELSDKSSPAAIRTISPVQQLTGGVPQAPSTLAAMARHGELPPVNIPVQEAPDPVAVVAHTPAAQAAMQSRQEAINRAIAGKIDKGQTSPRKF